MTKIAIVRVRGKRGLNPDIALTIDLLRLNKPNHCVIIQDNPSFQGMLKKSKDYVTWGEISKEMMAHLIYKRAEIGKKRFKEVYDKLKAEQIAEDFFAGKDIFKENNISPVFRLNPPGEYRDSKQPYKYSGRLGNRKNLDPLLKKMV